MGNPLRDASVTVTDCVCVGNAQRMDLSQVTAAIDCTVCRQIALKVEGGIDYVIAALRNAAHQPPPALECGCPGGSLNLSRVAVIVHCGVCRRVAVGLGNADIDPAISTLEYIRDNMPESQRYRSAS
jgi:hypothetical protein